MKHEIYYATNNSGKFEEAKSCIEKYAPFIDLKQLDVDLEEIQTLDQSAIAIDKARKAYDLVKKPVLVDDGGIYFEKYNQFPGTLTKFFYSAIGFDGVFKLVSEGDKASFVVTVAYFDGTNATTFKGQCDGTIVNLRKDVPFHPRMPFTAIFKPNGCDKTYAELRGKPEKEPFAFRQHAIKSFLEWYENNFQTTKMDDSQEQEFSTK
jgi:XTP/dITP diphosphohydrolase